MAPAADLLEAADRTAEDLALLWRADTLQADMIAFASSLFDDFPDQTPSNHPIANWLAVISAFAPRILAWENGGSETGLGSISTFQTSVDYIYRICKLAYYYEDQGGITAPQAAAVLAAWNANFAS